MHIGIISSSLGGRLGDACPTTGGSSTQALAGGGTLDRHNDDQAHLLDRGADPMNLTNYTENQVTAARRVPTTSSIRSRPRPRRIAANAGVTPTGPHAGHRFDGAAGRLPAPRRGCSPVRLRHRVAARELVPLPHPAGSLRVAGEGHRQREHRGSVGGRFPGRRRILAQRADFLRPDSLVAILVRTDEHDSEVDVRSFGGTGFNFMATTFNPAAARHLAVHEQPGRSELHLVRLLRPRRRLGLRDGRQYTAARPTGATTSTSVRTCTRS